MAAVNLVNWPNHCEHRVVAERVEWITLRNGELGRYWNRVLIMRCAVCGREGEFYEFTSATLADGKPRQAERIAR